MALLITELGQQRCLAAIVNKSPAEDMVLRLFVNDKQPGAGDVATDYSEADFAGYAQLILSGARWRILSGDRVAAIFPEQIFVNATRRELAQEVFGYYVTQTKSGILMWAERFSDGPYAVGNEGDQIRVTPRLEIR